MNIIGNPITAGLDPAVLNTKERIANKVTAIDMNSTDEQYPSAKAVFDFVNPFYPIPLGTSLEDAEWEEISNISEMGFGDIYWDVGDTKSVSLSGTVGTLSLNTTLYCYILSFDHNSAKEGAGIHFGTWKDSDGKDICLIDSQYGIISAGSTGDKYFQMNHWGDESSSPYNTNYGGWKGCDARYDILGSTDKQPSDYGKQHTTSCQGYNASETTAKSPVSNTMMSCLPSDLRAVMKPITKYTDNSGNNGALSTSIDYLPLLSEFEIFGTYNYSNVSEQYYQAQYQYYISGNSKVKYQHISTDLNAFWWERSPGRTSSYSFCVVNGIGGVSANQSNASYGIAPVFMV